MSVGEIAYRAHEQLKRARWRGYRGGWSDFEIGDGGWPALPGVRRRIAGASPELRRTIGQATQTILHRPLEIFGQVFGNRPLPNLIRDRPSIFHLDPVTGRHWPHDKYCFDIPYRAPAGYGDYKFCAELNTLQLCQTLAASACLERDEDLGRIVWEIWDSWYDANPPFQGISWVTGVNIALRVVSLLMTVSLVHVPRPEMRMRVRALLNASGFWLERYPSLHSSANNHLIAESVALFALGTLVPDLPNGRRYAELGRRRIEREVFRQILPDGVGAEMSPSYTAFAIEWVSLGAVVADAAGEPFEAAIFDRLGAAASHFKWLMDNTGRVPSIGDNDNSCVIASGRADEPRYVASITAAIAGVTANSSLTPIAYDRSLRDLVFQSPSRGREPGPGIRHFEHGGLTVVRERRGAATAVLIFDHGPLGYLGIGAHGHADTLAIWLSIGVQPVFVDAGTCLYGGDSRWRNYFRSTAAHNTVEVLGRSSSVVAGAFNWSRRARGRLLAAHDDENWSIEAQHDGYMASLRARHVRRLKRSPTGVWVEDRLEGHAAPARIAFVVDPALRTVIVGKTVRILRDNEPLVSLSSLSGWRPRVVRGVEDPIAGWYSEQFGSRAPADQIVFAGELGEWPTITEIVIHPTARGPF
jgi:uncharacterized heparinase superfamily protein